MVERWSDLEGTFFEHPSKYLYGYVGADDRRMHPLIRPGSLVLVDPKLRQIKNSGCDERIRAAGITSWRASRRIPLLLVPECEGGKLILDFLILYLHARLRFTSRS